jgi:hypothetical protein
MEECDNPFILPLFDFAIETTARRGSLFKLEWCDVDFERRYAMLYDTKGGHNVPVPLTLRAMEILKRLPRDPGQTKVFPITISALKSAWARACKRAGIDNLHFHDGRHIGTTQHAKRLRSPHMLMQITGHLTTGQLGGYPCRQWGCPVQLRFAKSNATSPHAGSSLLTRLKRKPMRFVRNYNKQPKPLEPKKFRNSIQGITLAYASIVTVHWSAQNDRPA